MPAARATRRWRTHWAKKKPRPKARQFIREETPRKGRGVSDASRANIYGAAHNRSSRKTHSVGEKRRAQEIVTKFQCGDLKAQPPSPMLHRNRRPARKPHMRSEIMRLSVHRRAQAACGAATMARGRKLA
jgi:hypothetical protein